MECENEEKKQEERDGLRRNLRRKCTVPSAHFFLGERSSGREHNRNREPTIAIEDTMSYTRSIHQQATPTPIVVCRYFLVGAFGVPSY